MTERLINMLFLFLASPSLMAYSLWLSHEGFWAHRNEEWEDRDHGGEILAGAAGAAGAAGVVLLIVSVFLWAALFLGRY